MFEPVYINPRVAETRWAPIPEGAWSPVRAGGYPRGYQIEKEYFQRPPWGCWHPPYRDHVRVNRTGVICLTCNNVHGEARMRGYELGEMDLYLLREVPDQVDRNYYRNLLAVAEGTPRPPAYIYAESFSPLLVTARRVYVTPVEPSLEVAVPPGFPELYLGDSNPRILPVWQLGRGLPWVGADGSVWEAQLLTGSWISPPQDLLISQPQREAGSRESNASRTQGPGWPKARC